MLSKGWTSWLPSAAIGCTAALLLSACGDAQSPPEETDAQKLARGYTEMNGFLVPPRQIPDPGLPDSCVLLTEADPKGMIEEPLAPIERMSNVCIAYAVSTPTLEHSLAVELRRPEPIELESQGHIPSNREEFWVAEGAGIGLLGGDEKGVQEIPGIGDYAVWYPISDGLALHAYWQGRYILRITNRGVAEEPSLAWAKQVALRAIDATAALEGQSMESPAATAPEAMPQAPTK